MNPDPSRYDDRLPPPAFPPGSGRRHHMGASADVLTDRSAPSVLEAPGAEQVAPEPSAELTATGIGATGIETGGGRPEDPFVRHLLEMLEELTTAVARRGEGGLKAEEGMSPFEATLRGYCVGYLAGLRNDEDHDASP